MISKLENGISNQQITELLEEPQVALSPSACFHTYLELMGQELERNSIFSFSQRVFEMKESLIGMILGD